MKLFRKKYKPYKLFTVKVEYTALVMAKNKIHAGNMLVDFENDVYDMTRKYIGEKPFDVHFSGRKVR